MFLRMQDFDFAQKIFARGAAASSAPMALFTYVGLLEYYDGYNSNYLTALVLLTKLTNNLFGLVENIHFFIRTIL